MQYTKMIVHFEFFKATIDFRAKRLILYDVIKYKPPCFRDNLEHFDTANFWFEITYYGIMPNLSQFFLSKGQAIITSSKDWVVGPENGQYYIYADILGGWVKKTL